MAKFKTTPTKKKNLTTLANYLLALPKGYKEFNMANFCSIGGSFNAPEPSESIKVISNCGAVACAVGHAPSAGIKPKKDEDWWDYSDRALIPTDTYEWEWCFGGDWWTIDNTPQGAGKRIQWLLEKGLPDNWSEQMDGDDPLCYEGETK